MSMGVYSRESSEGGRLTSLCVCGGEFRDMFEAKESSRAPSISEDRKASIVSLRVGLAVNDRGRVKMGMLCRLFVVST